VEADKEAFMTKVMRLLTIAEDERTNPHEAALCRERAERMMAQHTIDEFEARQRMKKGDTQARKPIQSEWEVVFDEMQSEDHEYTYELQHQLITLMRAVMTHCNIRVNDQFKWRDGKRIYQLVGFQEDVMYAERIWFNIFKAFVTNVNPQWDKTKSIGENAFNFASSGLSWPQIQLKAEKAGDTRVPFPDRWQCDDPAKPFYTSKSWLEGEMITKETAPDPKKWNFGLGKAIPLLRDAARDFAADNAKKYSYARGNNLRVASRNSFARSYRSTIEQRLEDIRTQTTQHREGEQDIDANKYALARRDSKEQVDEEFYRIFPEFDPEVRKRERERREAAAQAAYDALTPAEKAKLARDQAREDAKWAKRRTRVRANYGRVREDPTHRYDAAAWERGRQAGQSVNLRADEEVKKKDTKEIG
jgi:hypothetical protein